jgi:hypothetical protein
MTDMTSAIVPKSDQINADDLIGGTRTIRIADVSISPGADQPVSIKFEGESAKVWRPCKSMSRVLVAAWGPDAKAYVGRSVTLYRDPTVKWGGMQVGGIRISHMSHIDKTLTLALTETKGKRAPFVVKPMGDQPAATTSQPVAPPPLDPAVESAGRAAAGQGTDALRAWWGGLSRDQKVGAQTLLDGTLKALASEADSRPSEPQSEPADDFPGDRPMAPADTGPEF